MINCPECNKEISDQAKICMGCGIRLSKFKSTELKFTEKKNRLFAMQRRLPKQRTSVFGMGNNSVIDYTYANYDVDIAKKDYMAVSDELRDIQTALDLVNSTITFEIDIEE